jgi:hypothetical protein
VTQETAAGGQVVLKPQALRGRRHHAFEAARRSTGCRKTRSLSSRECDSVSSTMEAAMRDMDEQTGKLFSYVDLERRGQAKHPLIVVLTSLRIAQ